MTAISGSRVTIKLPLNRDHLAAASLISTKLKATADIVKKVEMEVLAADANRNATYNSAG